MVEIATSILTVPKDKIIKTIYNLETAKTDYFHIDVMDGLFVESFTNEIMEQLILMLLFLPFSCLLLF